MTKVTVPAPAPRPSRVPARQDAVHAARYTYLVVLGGAFLLVWIFVVDGALGLLFVYAPVVFLIPFVLVPLVRLLHAVGVWVLHQLH